MADEKKPEGSKAPPAGKSDAFSEIVTLLVGLLLVVSLVNGFLRVITSTTLYREGLKGFTTEAILRGHSRPIASLDNPLGVTIVNTNKTSVYNSPDGRKIGEQKINSRGKILQGPVNVGGVKYWYVDYDKGADGWVRETDIAYLESEPNILERILIFILMLAGYLKILLILFSFVCIGGIVYLFRKINHLSLNEHKLLYPESKQIVSATNPQWERVLSHIESQNSNDWRLAIIEADIMLAALLGTMSLPGDTIGEKLKSIERSDFLSLDAAWAGHKVRNQIAHDGETFLLSQHEAQRVIHLYKVVFEEFKMI